MGLYTGYANATPHEVLGGIFDAFVAPAGTHRPYLDLDPSSPWTLVGTGGSRNVSDDGVVIDMPQSVNPWRSLKSMGPVKLFRVSEDVNVKFSVADMTLETFAQAFEGNTVTTVPPGGHVGYRWMGITRGPNVSQKALLLRFASPYGDDLAAQLYIPIVSLVGNPSLGLKKGQPMLTPFEFMGVEDPDAASDQERMGIYEAVDEAVAS